MPGYVQAVQYFSIGIDLKRVKVGLRSAPEPGDLTRVMGVINVTPDSFYDGGRYDSRGDAISHGMRLAAEGADVLDVGGESSRPGADPVSWKDEIERVEPVIAWLAERTQCAISVDTTKAEVAGRALDAGADWVNDISAGLLDPEILDVVAEAGVPYVAMHMRGTPKMMQSDTGYGDLVDEIDAYFAERLETFEKAGIDGSQVILDPGIGFGKSPEDNYTLLARLDDFRKFGRPLLVGPSRKSFLALAGAKSPEERLPGTISAVTICALGGVEVVRVHDVAATLQAIRVARLVDDAGKIDAGK